MFEFERATTMDALNHAWQKVSAKNGCAGSDGVPLSLYRSDLRSNLRTLQTAVISGNYRPYAEKIYTYKNRDIAIHCVDDKIMQTAAAEIIMETYVPSPCVHGFIKKRSIFTAKKLLDDAVKSGIIEYCKVDIRHFYNSIDTRLLLKKLAEFIGDPQFLALAELLIGVHSPGISTGSCLSPGLGFIDNTQSKISMRCYVHIF